MPRLCANIGFLFPEMPFLDRFDAAARAGFTGVEFASPYEYPAAELRARLQANGLSLVLINSPAGNRAAGERGFACLPGRTDTFRDGVSQALDYAAALDCKLIHVMAGVPPADLAYDTALALYAVNLAWAAERAKTAGVKLVIEPLNPRDALPAQYAGAGRRDRRSDRARPDRAAIRHLSLPDRAGRRDEPVRKIASGHRPHAARRRARPARARHRRDRLGVRVPPYRRARLFRLDRLRIRAARRHRPRPGLAPALRGVAKLDFVRGSAHQEY
jgi:hypothetical protein